MSVVGIDFGNLGCVVAVAKNGSVETVTNSLSKRMTPSVITIDGEERFIGEMSTSKYKMHFANSATQPKRLIGRRWADPDLQDDLKYLWFEAQPSEDQSRVMIKLKYGDKVELFTPEQITATLLVHLKSLAEKALNMAVRDCVITIPPHFTDVQRRAMLDAAQIAGLRVLRLMNDTTAVALQYGILRKLPADEEKKVVFVDVGHASTKVAIVSLVQGKLQVLSTASDRNLGGRNFDRVLYDHFRTEIQSTKELNITGNPRAMMRLMDAAESAKKVLSANSETTWAVECLMNDVDVSGLVKRETFEELCKPLLDRIIAPMKECVEIAKVQLKDIDSVEVIGGSSRIPVVRSMIETFFCQPVKTTCDGDESVARGAALQCAMLSPSFKVRNFEVHDISPYPIEVGYGPIGGPIEDTAQMFEPCNQIPSIKMISFHRTDDFEIQARYSKTAVLPEGVNPLIGVFTISGPKTPTDEGKPPKTKVKIKLDHHGVLSVASAQVMEEYYVEEKKSGQSASEPGISSQQQTVPSEVQPDRSAEDIENEAQDKAGDEVTKETCAMDESTPEPRIASSETVRSKKVKRVDLQVNAMVEGSLTLAMINAAVEKEASMSLKDRVIAETSAAKNDLESYIYEMRDKIELDMSEFVEDDSKQSFLDELMNAEDWLYSEGESAQKSVYVSKLDNLKKVGNPIELRSYEFAHRDEHISQLKAAIVLYQQWAESDNEQSSHIDQAKKDEVAAECRQVDEWLRGMLAEQAKLTKAHDPVIKIADLESRLHHLRRFADPIMNTPKPKPKVASPKKEEPKPASETDSRDCPPVDTEMSDARAESDAGAASAGEQLKDEAANQAPEPAMDVD